MDREKKKKGGLIFGPFFFKKRFDYFRKIPKKIFPRQNFGKKKTSQKLLGKKGGGGDLGLLAWGA